MKRNMHGIISFWFTILVAVALINCSFAMSFNDMVGDSKIDLVADEVKERVEKKCDGDLVFNDCGSFCTEYCGSKKIRGTKSCILSCKSGCECPRGLIRSTKDGTTCITKEDCRGSK